MASLCVSQRKVSNKVTVQFGDNFSNMCVGLCTSREPKDIVQCASKGSRKHVFSGSFLDMSDNTLTLLTNNEEYPDQAFVVDAFRGNFLTIAFGAEELRASLASKNACVSHGLKLDNRNFYAIAIMDKRSDLHPCWSIM